MALDARTERICDTPEPSDGHPRAGRPQLAGLALGLAPEELGCGQTRRTSRPVID
jgi:heterodisulfide reductase subunit B